MSGRDASGDGFTGGVSGSEEEAAWRDLIARYELPADQGSGQVPWPEREDLADDPAAPPGTEGGDQADTAGSADDTPEQAVEGPGDTDSTDHAEGTDRPAGQGAWFSRTRVIRPATPPPPTPPAATPPAATPPEAPPPASPSVPAAGSSMPAGPGAAAGGHNGPPDIIDGLDINDQVAEADDPDEHYIPPPPPPLPHLDPVAKGAWAALFGGPAYLLVSTLVGLSTPGWAALLAVAAFVGGFAVVVLRLGDGPSRGDGPDNGAVL